MKKLISPKMRLLVIIIFISLITIYNYTNYNNITYLSLGDGYAKGKNSYGIDEYGYSDYIKDNLKKDNKLKEYVNCYSSDNKTIKELYNDICYNKEIDNNGKKMLLKEKLQEADILTLSIGINDLISNISLEENIDYKKIIKIEKGIEEEFNNLINEIKKYYKHDIYVVGIPNINIKDYYLSMAIRKYNEFLKLNKNIIYIPINDLEYNKEKYFFNSKSNYYNSDGYFLIADKIYKTIKKA